jgi:hypothetical protein
MIEIFKIGKLIIARTENTEIETEKRIKIKNRTKTVIAEVRNEKESKVYQIETENQELNFITTYKNGLKQRKEIRDNEIYSDEAIRIIIY